MGAPSYWYLCPPWMRPLWLLDCRLGPCLTTPPPPQESAVKRSMGRFGYIQNSWSLSWGAGGNALKFSFITT